MILLYIDPGAGSMVIQALLAGLLAAPFFLRTHLTAAIHRIRGLRNRNRDDSPTA